MQLVTGARHSDGHSPVCASLRTRPCVAPVFSSHAVLI